MALWNSHNIAPNWGVPNGYHMIDDVTEVNGSPLHTLRCIKEGTSSGTCAGIFVASLTLFVCVNKEINHDDHE